MTGKTHPRMAFAIISFVNLSLRQARTTREKPPVLAGIPGPGRTGTDNGVLPNRHRKPDRSGRALWAAALLALAACAPDRSVGPWLPEEFPVDVVVVDPPTTAMAAVLEGAGLWGRGVGQRVFAVSEASGGERRCGRIHVEFGYVNEANASWWDTRAPGRREPCWAVVTIDAERIEASGHSLAVVVAHELGHAILGAEHSSDPRSIMHEFTGSPDQVLTEEDVAAAREAMGVHGAQCVVTGLGQGGGAR